MSADGDTVELGDADWEHCSSLARKCVDAQVEENFAALVQLQREYLRFILSRLIHFVPERGDDVDVAMVESALALPRLGLRERMSLIELCGRLGVITNFLGGAAEALPWLRLADTCLEALVRLLESGADLPEEVRSYILDSIKGLRFEVSGALSFALNEHGLVTQSLPAAGDADRRVTRSADTLSLAGSLLGTLDAAMRLHKRGYGQKALGVLDSFDRNHQDAYRSHSAVELICAKRQEILADMSGQHLRARQAVLRQLQALASSGPVLAAVEAGIYADAMLYSLRAGKFDCGISDAAQALTLIAAEPAASRGTSWRIFAHLSEAEEERGRLWAACLFLKIAQTQQAAARERLGQYAADLAEEIDDEHELLHEVLARLLTELGRLAEAAAVVELGMADGPIGRTIAWTAAEELATREIQAKLAAAARGGDEIRRELADALRASADEVERSGDARRQAVNRLHSELRSRALASLPDGSQLDVASVHYIVEQSRTTVLVRVGHTETSIRLPLPAATVHAFVSELLARIRDARFDPRPLLQRGYDLFLAPIEGSLAGVRRALMAAPGVLHGLPWSVLYDGKQYAAERWSFVRATGIDVDLKVKPAPNATIAAFAATRAGAGFPALGLRAQEEVAAAVALFGGSAHVDEDFTRFTLGRQLRTATVLHLVSHIAPHAARAERSQILLGDGSTLSIGDLLGLGVAGLDMVVVSACSSGVLDASAVAEREFSLDALWLAHGVRSVMSTSWPVDNESAAALMAGFYRELRRGSDKDEALVRVQRSFISGEIGGGRWRLPLHWGAAALSGNWLGWTDSHWE